MITSVKERELHLHSEIEIYRNLNKKCFSIKDKKTKLVVAHVDGVLVRNCKMKVSEAGRQRVIRDQRKNVHSIMLGEFLGEASYDVSLLNEVYYDPYKLNCFVLRDSNGNYIRDIHEANCVYFYNGKAYLVS